MTHHGDEISSDTGEQRALLGGSQNVLKLPSHAHIHRGTAPDARHREAGDADVTTYYRLASTLLEGATDPIFTLRANDKYLNF